MRDRTEIYIGGQWRAATSGRTIEVENPATGQVVATVPEASLEDVDAAVAAARPAFPVWATTEVAERVQVLRALSEELAARRDDIADRITQVHRSPGPTGAPGSPHPSHSLRSRQSDAGVPTREV